MPDNLYRRGTVWWARAQVRGREVRKSLRTSRLAEARKRLTAFLDGLTHERFHGQERYSWKMAVGRWTLEHQTSVKPSTAKRYLCSLGQIAVAPIDNRGTQFDSLYLDEITRKTIAQLVAARKKAGAGNATIRRDLTAVSVVLGAAVAWGWREDNPAKEWDRSVIRERRDPIVLPEASAIDRVCAKAPGNFSRMIRFAQFTGMRQEEIAGLERHQVDLQRRAADLSRTKTSTPRSVPLDDRAVGTLVGTPAHLRCRHVFWHPAGENGVDGERYRNVSSRFSEIVRSVAKEAADKGESFRAFRFHDLRHWYAVDYLRAGGSIYRLQQILGHSSIKTTEIYLDFLTPEEQEAAKASAQ